MKKKFMENKKFRLIAVFLITVLIVGGFSLAWFYVRKYQYDLMSVSNFQATPECYFDFEGSEIPAGDFTDSEGLIKLSVEETDADNNKIVNYIGNFRVRVNYTGDGAGYLRVRMVHEFSNGSESVQHPAKLPYATSSSLWFDNRDVDYCYYYADKLNIEKDETKSIDLITGLVVEKDENNNPTANDGATIVQGFADANAEIRVAVEADMVQINRYPQIWGINEIPRN